MNAALVSTSRARWRFAANGPGPAGAGLRLWGIITTRSKLDALLAASLRASHAAISTQGLSVRCRLINHIAGE